MAEAERIGPYEVLRLLGKGGMGAVHLALDGEGRAVAVKVMHDRLAEESGLRRMRREVEAMRRVRSPHVAEMLDFELEDDRPYVVTRYVQGRSLRGIVEERGPLSHEELVRLGVGLARAMEAIHGAKVLHRDLTPNNVMLVEGEPVVIDLGIALIEDITRMSSGPIGTPGYIAPEVLRAAGAGAESEAGDVFAWGAVMVYAATGRHCFSGSRTEAIVYRVVHEDPDLSGVPEGLLATVRAALDKDPKRRPSVPELLEALAGPESLWETYWEVSGRAEHERAEEIAGRIHALAVGLGDRGTAARALIEQAHSARYQRAFGRAGETYGRVLELARETGDREAECWALDGLGVCARGEGDPERARRWFAEALGAAIDAGQRELHVWNLCNLGGCARERGDRGRAVDLYEQAREAAARYDLPAIGVHVADGLGNCLRKEGEPARAEQVFREARDLATRVGDQTMLAWSVNNLGHCARELRRLGDAEALHREALELARRLGDRAMEGWILTDLAACLKKAGDLGRAADLYGRAHRLARDLGHAEIESAAARGLARTGHRLT